MTIGQERGSRERDRFVNIAIVGKYMDVGDRATWHRALHAIGCNRHTTDWQNGDLVALGVEYRRVGLLLHTKLNHVCASRRVSWRSHCTGIARRYRHLGTNQAITASSNRRRPG